MRIISRSQWFWQGESKVQKVEFLSHQWLQDSLFSSACIFPTQSLTGRESKLLQLFCRQGTKPKSN